MAMEKDTSSLVFRAPAWREGSLMVIDGLGALDGVGISWRLPIMLYTSHFLDSMRFYHLSRLRKVLAEILIHKLVWMKRTIHMVSSNRFRPRCKVDTIIFSWRSAFLSSEIMIKSRSFTGSILDDRNHFITSIEPRIQNGTISASTLYRQRESTTAGS